MTDDNQATNTAEQIANYLRIHLDVPVYVAGECHPEPHIIEGVTFDCDGRRCYICAKSGSACCSA